MPEPGLRAENRPPQSSETADRASGGMSGTPDLGVLARFLPGPVSLTERAIYRLGSTAPSTIRAYLADWTDFRSWCTTHHHTPLPGAATTVTGYIAYLASLTDETGTPTVASATLQRRTAAIAYAHDLADLPSPTAEPIVGDALRFWAHQRGTAPERKAKPLTTRLLRQVVEAIPPSRAGARNRALLLIGFAGALRRSEVAALQYADIEQVDEGLIVTIRTSKTDQTGHGELIGIPYGANPTTCPVRAHQTWVQHRGTSPGAWLLRINRGDRITTPLAGITGAAVNDIVQHRVSHRRTPRRVQRPLTTRRVRHRRRRSRPPRMGHHDPIPPPLPHHHGRLHPPRQPLQRKPRQRRWAVTRTDDYPTKIRTQPALRR